MMESYGLDLKEVERCYVDELMSLSQLAKQFNVTVSTVRHRLRKMGVSLRPSIRHNTPDYGLTREFLEREYLQNKKTYKQIADERGCSESNVWYKIKKFQIPARTASEAIKGVEFSVSHREALSKSHLASTHKRTGAANPNWRGGVATENYLARRTNEFINWRRKVLRHKGKVCSACGKGLGERCPCCGRITDKHVHHVREFSENPDLRYSLDNAVVLCESCHQRLHKKQGLYR